MRLHTFCRTVAAVLGICVLIPSLHGAVTLGSAEVSPAGDVCGRCHQFNPLFSHPVNVKPSMPVPDALPLSDGRLTCVTCHSVTGPDHAATQAPLRLSAPQLCDSCHQNTPLSARVRHGANIRRAHLARSSTTAQQAGELDAESRNCMSCHDGSVANDAGTIRGMDTSQLEAEHPIGNVYGVQLKDSSLAPSGLLDSRIRLLDGKVGCGSCHSPYSTQKLQLVIPNRGAALCLSCHQL